MHRGAAITNQQPGTGTIPDRAADGSAAGNADDRPLALHELTFLDEGEEVTVGRAAVESYAILPADGAALLRRLVAGEPPSRAAEWYERTYGEPVDVAEFVATLAELDFLRSDVDGSDVDTGTAAEPEPVRPVRGQRLGSALFSTPAWLCYGALVGWCVVAAGRSTDLLPRYQSIFFSQYLTVVELVLFLGQVPLLLVHEGFHALAGRRLGLRSRLSLGRRLYYLVFETSMDGLVTVPRRQRYLPMLAGMLADVLIICALTVAADLTRRPDGQLSTAGGICLALAFGTVLRLSWQFYFYLRTDIYQVISVVIGCVDLHGTTQEVLRNRWDRLRGRPPRFGEDRWHPRDRRTARWYSWLVPLGYTFSIGVLVVAAAPVAYRFLSGVFGRFGDAGATRAELADSAVFLGLNLIQLVIVIALVVADRRRQRATAAPA